MSEDLPDLLDIMPTPGLPEPEEITEERHGFLAILRDNLEAFTVALIMALVIKHFCVEAFKIPTGSMFPTLYGEKNDPNEIGDRILVDKWAYLLSGPDRWDVIVFRYPLNRSKHFIKRVGGLPGEWIRIIKGDLWTRRSVDEPWRIATKRRLVRDELYLPVYPPDDAEPPTWRRDEAPAAAAYWDTSDAWHVDGHGSLRFDGGPRARTVFQKRIGKESSPTDYDLDGYGELVRDVRFRMTLTADVESQVVLRWRTEEEAYVELTLSPPLAVDASALESRRGESGVSTEVDADLVPGTPLNVELECVDGQVYVLLDGREVAHLDEQRAFDARRALQDYVQSFEIEATGGALEISDLQIDRDVHYVTKGMPGLDSSGDGVRVPDDHYFMLGDNTEGSSDSRQWELSGVILEDGSEIWYEAGNRENRAQPGDDGRMAVVDLDGVERRWWPRDVERRETKAMPFVDRDLIVGRAFFIFWPVTPHFPGRAGFIH